MHTDYNSPLYFTGKMVFRAHFGAYPGLTALLKVADRIAQVDYWSDLYNIDQLSMNNVLVYSATYVDDMYWTSSLRRRQQTLSREQRRLSSI